jgi:hypothetical protein
MSSRFTSVFVNEALTSKLLNDNNMEVKLPLCGFIQNYLSSRYNFVPPLDFKKRIDSGKIYDIREFAIYMFQCNALLQVECIDFDHTCFIVSKENTFDIVQYSIPQYDGFDYVIRNTSYIDFNFIKTPFFILNNIVHPVTYDTKTLYLYGLYEIFNSPTFDKILMPFGEGIFDFFKKCKIQMLSFDDVVSKLILSQLPSFNDYFEAILPILLDNITIIDTYPTVLKIPKDFSYPESKSSVLLSINPSSPPLVSEYDEKLLKKYDEKLDKVLPFETPVYSYPLYIPINKPLIYNINSSLSYGVYIKLYNRIMKHGMTEKLQRIYKLKKSLASYLKSYYFSYHMQHTVFKHLYPVSAFINHERVSQNDNLDYQPQSPVREERSRANASSAPFA